MHPILFTCGPVIIYSYGLMVATAWIVATWLALNRAEASHIGRDTIINLSFCLLISGIAGARTLYIVLHIREYLQRPSEMIMLHHGGLVFFGGLIGGAFTGIWFLKKNRLPVWKVADVLIPYVALGQAIGRIGCLLNGCCYGKPTTGWFSLSSPERFYPSLHPTQIYSALNALAIFLITRFFQDRPHRDGQIFLSYCMLYSFTRFFIEFLRGDNPSFVFGLTISQLIGGIGFFVSSAIYFAARKKLCSHR